MGKAESDALALPRELADALATGRCGDPFAILGPHRSEAGTIVRVFLRGARGVELRSCDDDRWRSCVLRAQGVDGLYAGLIPHDSAYRLHISWPDGVQETEDPYAFGLLLDEALLQRFASGEQAALAAELGAVPMTVAGVAGVRFAVWAPNARRVSVVGDFNSWDGSRHSMRRRHTGGVWELFVPRLGSGERYKFEILGAHGLLPLKADPLARQMEVPPGTASLVAATEPFDWGDGAWIATRPARHADTAPLSIYEVHLPSWRRAQGRGGSWTETGEALIDYACDLGFTHLELLPVSAHPFGGSWGYQPLGLYAPDARLGTPLDLQRFVDRCHARGLGVIIDWVPAHFPSDEHGLARFDGSALYEHADPREGFHPDWNTLIYNLGRVEVCAFLLGSALHWIEHYHVDGLRVDAVASMLYRDYSRREGEWVPNRHGGRENEEAVSFLRRLNALIHSCHPGVMTIAEESTAWPGVTTAVDRGGLGFSYKWNMGWMHDTLRYMQHEPVHRAYCHDDISFGLVYAYSERFVLPLSHDEVVHGKRSLLGRMPGDAWQRFANLRAYYGFMWTHPGKKLLFMGGEMAQTEEWNHDAQLDWPALDARDADGERRRGVQRLVADLNRLYRENPALHASDAAPDGFRWIIGDDRQQSVFAFLRQAPGAPALLVVCNFTPVPRSAYRVGVPQAGLWSERLNTDAADYGGTGVGNLGGAYTSASASHGERQSLQLSLPPLATLVLQAPGP